MSIFTVFIAAIVGSLFGMVWGYVLGCLAFGLRDATITPGYTEDEVYGAFEGAILAEFEVAK